MLLPRDYQRFHDLGLTGDDWRVALRFSRFRWLRPDAIAQWEYPVPRIGHFVPFAASPNGDTFAWCAGSRHDDLESAPIVYSPRDEDQAEIVCVGFGRFLVWTFVDEARECWLMQTLDLNEEQVRDYLVSCVARSAKFLPTGARDLLIGAFGGPTSHDRWGNLQWLGDGEIAALRDRFVTTAESGRRFCQFA